MGPQWEADYWVYVPGATGHFGLFILLGEGEELGEEMGCVHYTAKHLCLFMCLPLCLAHCVLMSCGSDYWGNERHHCRVSLNSNHITLVLWSSSMTGMEKQSLIKWCKRHQYEEGRDTHGRSSLNITWKTKNDLHLIWVAVVAMQSKV